MAEERKVDAELAGARLDKAVVALWPGASRAKVKNAIIDRKIRVNGFILPKGGVVNETPAGFQVRSSAPGGGS